VIPATAVMVDQGKISCFAVANGQIVRVPVELGIRTRSEVEVVSGLAGEESIIPKNPASLHEGQRAEIVN
jgi:multidrug efflux pump subunit AcrA (membrane-fusion protein)